MGSFPYVIRVFVVCRLSVRCEYLFSFSYLWSHSITTDITYHLVRVRREKDAGGKGREGEVVDKKEGHEKWYEVPTYLQQNKKGESRG
jgi:hypothetical protein